jgi:hypothetical protein
MRMNGFQALHKPAQITCQQSSSKCPSLPTRNLQCMSCGRSMLVGVPTPDLAVRSRFPLQIQRDSRCPAASLAIESLFFHLFTRVGFRGLSIDSWTCSCDPFLRCRLPFRPGCALLSRSETVAPSQSTQTVHRFLISLYTPCRNACQAISQSVKHALVIVD